MKPVKKSYGRKRGANGCHVCRRVAAAIVGPTSRKVSRNGKKKSKKFGRRKK